MHYKIYKSRNQKTKLQSLKIFIIYNAFTYVCKNGHKNSPSAIERYLWSAYTSNYSVIISANMKDTCPISEIRK